MRGGPPRGTSISPMRLGSAPKGIPVLVSSVLLYIVDLPLTVRQTTKGRPEAQDARLDMVDAIMGPAEDITEE